MCVLQVDYWEEAVAIILYITSVSLMNTKTTLARRYHGHYRDVEMDSHTEKGVERH